MRDSCENRLLQITEQQGKIQTFGYDSDGNRLYKTVGVYWQAPTEPGPIKTTPPPQGNGNGNGKDKGNNGNPGQGNGQDKKLSDVQSNTSVVAVFRMLAAGGNGNGGGNGGGNSGGNSGGGNSGGNSNSGGGNSGGNGNSGSKGNGQDKSIHDNGKDQEKGNDSGKHVGWDKKKLKRVKGNKGKHLGWYKRADHPMNPNDEILNKPDAYEVINYINDVSLKNTQTLMTTDKDGVYRGVYTFGNERIAERDLVAVEGVPNDPLYYLYDGHNSVTQMINSAGHVRDKYRYDPFGTPMPGGKLSPNTRLFNNPYGYNGEAHDIDSGLQFLRARYYDPSMGRFQTRDSYLGEITRPLTLNRYVYTANNPVMYSDPSGHRLAVGGDYETPEERQLSLDAMKPSVYKYESSTLKTFAPLLHSEIVPEISSVGPTISNSVYVPEPSTSTNKAYIEEKTEKSLSYNNNGCDISSQGTVKPNIEGTRPTLSEHRDSLLNRLNNDTLESNRRFGLVDDGGRPFITKGQLEFNEQAADAIVYGNVAMLGGAALEPIATPILGKIGSLFGKGAGEAAEILNKKGLPYPKVEVNGYGEVPFPEGPYNLNNSTTLRPQFTDSLKKGFKEWWTDQGRTWPEGEVNIHHIKPLSKGGDNSFENLVPLVQPLEHQPFTNWWRSYP